MGLLHWLDHWLASLERALVVLLLTGLLGLGLLQVIERNVLASGIFWADELLQHMVLWLGFLGASLATREHRHLSIDVLSHFLPTRWQLWLGLLVNTVALVLCTAPCPGCLGVGAFRVHGWHHVDLWGTRLAGAKHHTAGVWGDHTAFRLASGGDTGPIGPARGRGMILLGLLLVLLAILGTPLFAVFGALAWFLFRAAGIDASAIMIELYRLASAPTLLPIPLFTFAGYVLAASQAPQRLVRCMQALIGWLPGGLALMALCACAFFTAFTGASGVTIVALGGFLLPVLLKERYPELFSLGLLTTCGSLGLLFPPSLPIILYGLVAHAPVDLLFLAGVVPGLRAAGPAGAV